MISVKNKFKVNIAGSLSSMLTMCIIMDLMNLTYHIGFCLCPRQLKSVVHFRGGQKRPKNKYHTTFPG